MLPGFQKGLLLGQGNLKDELTTKTKIRCTLWGFFLEGIFLECHAFGSYKVLIYFSHKLTDRSNYFEIGMEHAVSHRIQR